MTVKDNVFNLVLKYFIRQWSAVEVNHPRLKKQLRQLLVSRGEDFVLSTACFFFLHAAILQVFPGLIRKFSKRSRIYLGSRVLVGVPGR